jgi:hypothetical protein
MKSDIRSEYRNSIIEVSFRPSALHNQMALLRGKIEQSLLWQGLCLVSTTQDMYFW